MRKLSGLTIFFPFFNDEGTVLRQIKLAYEYGRKAATKLEVIAIHGGVSRDNTWAKIKLAKKRFPRLRIIDASDNTEGYAVIKRGLVAARNNWVFYTDGDAQYHLEESLLDVVRQQFNTHADVINGYKINRSDNIARVILGNMYAYFSRFLFELPIRDTDCDFRLIRRKWLTTIKLEATDAAILPELIKKLELVGARFAEVPIKHYPRIHGGSNYSVLQLVREKVIGDIKMYFKLRRIEKFRRNKRLVQFVLVGGFATGVQTGLYNWLLVFTTINLGLASVIADQTPIIIAYLLHKKYTFAKKGGGFGKFYGSVIVSTLIQAGTIYGVTWVFGRGFWVANMAFVLGAGLAFGWNYLVQSRIVFMSSAAGVPTAGRKLQKSYKPETSHR